MKRVQSLDGWRGCAILCVLIAHFISDHRINLGRFGVELFFVLSGRLMAEILFIRAADLPSFYARRIARIYPALLVLALAMIATAGWRAGDPSPRQFLAAISLTANYAQFWVGRSGVLDHVWSLCIEEHMYLLLGLIACVHRWRPLPLVPVLAALAVAAVTVGVVTTALGADYYAVYWRSDVRGASILMGAIAYLAWHEHPPAALARAWVPAVCVALALALNLNRVPDPVKYSLGTALLSAALVLVPHGVGRLRSVLEHPVLRRVGVWSYSLYLWQQPFAKLGGPLAWRLVHLGLAGVLAMASFVAVEQPLRRAINARLARRAASPVIG